MANPKRISTKTANEVLGRMLAFSRAVQYILDTRAVEVAGESLSASRVQILRVLERRGPQNSTQISQFLGVSKSAITRLVTILVTDRLVCRVTLESDRRAFLLELTSKGHDALKAVHKEQQHLVRSAFRQASDADPEHWAEVLGDMSLALTQSEEDFKKFCHHCGGFSDGSCVLSGGAGQCLFLKHAQSS